MPLPPLEGAMRNGNELNPWARGTGGGSRARAKAIVAVAAGAAVVVAAMLASPAHGRDSASEGSALRA